MNMSSIRVALLAGIASLAVALPNATFAEDEHHEDDSGPTAEAPMTDKSPTVGMDSSTSSMQGMMSPDMMQMMEAMMTPEMMKAMHQMMSQGGMKGMRTASQGMMGQGMMGQGMMGQGAMGQGMAGHGMMPISGAGAMMPGIQSGVPNMMGALGAIYGMAGENQKEMTPERVRTWLETRLEWHGNPRLQIGEIGKAADGSITAEIITIDGSVVQKLAFNRYPGLVRQINE